MANNQQISGIWTVLGIAGFIALLVISIAVIYPARLQYSRQLEFYAKVKAEADRKLAERDALQKEVAALERSPEAIEKVARENFRLCKEGEVVMYYKRPANTRR
ncbi:MAG: septum formation initiator family protein [Lentisphaerae bacterium]|nr:septum formation initiator family protein [Lentisphaerota bacterium]